MWTKDIGVVYISNSIFWKICDNRKFLCVYICNSFAVSNYVEAVKEVACEILELMAEELGVHDTSAFSRLIRAVDNDSLLRLNYYPPLLNPDIHHNANRVGFGEHSDPQILTILRSNGVAGLQISLDKGVWVPVAPDPSAFFVNVGDVLQVFAN